MIENQSLDGQEPPTIEKLRDILQLWIGISTQEIIEKGKYFDNYK
ncbi:MAG: hypothetical protein ABS944_04130 [Solibacillus sp.]